MDPVHGLVFVGWAILHVSALATAWGARIAAGSKWDVPLQLACFLAMAAIGTAAVICRQIETSLWIPSGMTLVAMVLTAVVDTGAIRESSTATHAFSVR